MTRFRSPRAALVAAALFATVSACAQTPLGVSIPPAAGEIAQSRRTAITAAVEAASPGVVSVNVIEVRQVRVRDPFADFFGGVPSRVYEQQVQGLGSGFIVSADGYIVTNDHVAGNASKITVAFPDGSTLDTSRPVVPASMPIALATRSLTGRTLRPV